MKAFGIIGLCALSLGVFAGCSAQDNDAQASGEAAATAAAGITVCAAGFTTIATTKSGIVTMTKTGALYTLATDEATALTLAADKTSGTWNGKAVSCKAASAADAPSWTAAGAMADYADQIGSLASTVADEMADMNNRNNAGNATAASTSYVVYAIETTKRDSLDLGTKVDKSQGALPGDDTSADTLYDDDNSYGGLSAAYDLGGGEDFGEWFQGAADGTSLGDSLGDIHAGFIAHEKTKAFDSLLASKGASAVEVTVGQWTFFAPSDFSK